MASTKEYLDFVLEQLSELDEVSSRAMMGEYIGSASGLISQQIPTDCTENRTVFLLFRSQTGDPVGGMGFRISDRKRHSVRRLIAGFQHLVRIKERKVGGVNQFPQCIHAVLDQKI